MAKKTKDAYIEQKMKNDNVWSYYMNRYAELAQSMYKWPDMGRFFDSRFAEAMLFTKGWCTIWYDDVIGSFLCGNVIPGAGLDIYGNITNWYVNAINGYHKELDVSSAVIMYNSEIRGTSMCSMVNRPVAPMIMLAEIVDEMTILHQSMLSNLKKLSVPLIFSGSEKQMLTMKNMVKYTDAMLPYVFIDNDVSQTLDGDIKAVKTDVPCHVDMYSTELTKAWCEGLTYLGLDNMAQPKKERLLVDEVNANNQQISTAAFGKLKARNRALDKLNAIYGTDFQVELDNNFMPAETIQNYSDKMEPPSPEIEYEASAAEGGTNNG